MTTLIFQIMTTLLCAADSTTNPSPPGQNGRHSADNIFKCIFLNENDRIPIQISLKFVPRSQVEKKPALVQVMAWRRTGDKPLPEPLLTQKMAACPCLHRILKLHYTAEA